MATWYLGSTKHAAVAQWAATTAYVVGDFVRQLAAPTKDNERVWRCTTAGTSGGTEPSWTLTKGSTTNDNTVVWTEVTGNSAYGWSAAAARLKLFANGGSSWAAAGDTIRMHLNHAESIGTGAETWTFPGTAASPNRILSVNDADTALSAGGKVVQGGNTNITFHGFAYFHGVTLEMGTGGTLGSTLNFNSGSPHWLRFENCYFNFTNTGTSNVAVGFNGSGQDDRAIELINTNIDFAGAGSRFALSGGLIWKGGTLGGTALTTLIINVSTGPNLVFYGYGLDLSLLAGSSTLAALNTGQMGEILFENCKLGSGVAYTSGTHPGQGGLKFRLVNCDSGATNYNFHGQDYAGTITSESTIVLNATTSRKMVSTANARKSFPLVLDDIILYNTTTGSSQTATVEVVTDGVTLNDDEMWLEVEYLGNASFPISSFANDRISDVEYGTPAAQTSSTASWVTTGLSSPTKQKLEVSFTAQLEGVVKLRVMLAKASTTVYVDPQASIA